MKIFPLSVFILFYSSAWGQLKIDLAKDFSITFLNANSDEFEEHIFKSNIEQIREESIKVQSNFYKGLLQDKRFKDCCPEYIEQANDFLDSDKESFSSLKDLSLEFVFKSTIIELTMDSESNKKFIKICKF